MFVMYAEIVHVQCQNGLHKYDFWEIIKSKIPHSYEAHTYLRHKGIARWFQRIETCLVEIEQTARPLETNAHANFPTAENEAYQCMENCWKQHALSNNSWLTVSVGNNVETKSRT